MLPVAKNPDSYMSESGFFILSQLLYQHLRVQNTFRVNRSFHAF